MTKYTADQIDQINQGIPIVEYVKNYLTLDFHHDEYWAICPFHDGDVNPSLSFNPEKNMFKCLGCDTKGTLIVFVMKYHKLSFPDAIEHILSISNIALEFKEHSDTMEYLQRVNRRSCEKPPIVHPVLSPDIMNSYTAKEIQEWLAEGMSAATLKKFQVRYDERKNAIVFPIRDSAGNIISVKSRTLFANHKELGIPKYIYYHNIGTNDFLFGLYENLPDIQAKKEVIVVEAEKGVMMLDSFGFGNCVALSTKIMNCHQIEILLSLKCRIVFAYDKDVLKPEIKKMVAPLSRFTNVEIVYDKNNLLANKESPYDRGLEIWQQLYTERILYERL
jgi:DNA primase